MTDASIVKEGDWLIPKDIETPQGPESGPMIYRIFKVIEDKYHKVDVPIFINQLAKVMNDFEAKMSTFSRVL